jgi:hypothetical protein
MSDEAFSTGTVPRLTEGQDKFRPCGGGFEYFRLATKTGTGGMGYNWVTLFLRDINKGTWGLPG